MNIIVRSVQSFLALFLIMANSFPARALADEGTVQEVSSEQIDVVRNFSNQYAEVQDVISALFGRPVHLKSENALSMYGQLQSCLITEQADGNFLSIGGDRCKVSYKLEATTENLGLNENGDPVTETTTNEIFSVLDSGLISQAGLSGWTTSRMERRDTLVSTPAHALTAVEKMYIVMADGREVEANKKVRLYTNMENQEETFFNQQTFNFKDFIIGYNVKVELTENGELKHGEAKINGEVFALNDVITIFTPAFVGLTYTAPGLKIAPTFK